MVVLIILFYFWWILVVLINSPIHSGMIYGIQAPAVVVRLWDFQHLSRRHSFKLTLPPWSKIIPVLRVRCQRIILYFMYLGSHSHVKPHCCNTVIIRILYPTLNFIPTYLCKNRSLIFFSQIFFDKYWQLRYLFFKEKKFVLRILYPRYACVKYLSELLSLLVFISGGYFAVSLLT